MKPGDLKPAPSPPAVVERQWAEVERFLDAPENQSKVSEPTARRLLELHHRLDGFELPRGIEHKLAQKLGLNPQEARSRFEVEKKAQPQDAGSFRELGKMLVDDLVSAISNLPTGPIRALGDILSETKDVLVRTKQPHLSKSEKKALRAHFDKLHGVLRDEMAKVQTGLSKVEQARDQLLSDKTGEPIAPEKLDARGQMELKKLDNQIAEQRGTLQQLGNVGLTFTTLRGESFWEQNWLALNAGVDVNAFMPVASAGVGGVREISFRDARTGKTEVKDSASAIGLVTNGFGRKVVSKEDIKAGNWKKIFSTKGMGGGFSPIPFVNVIRDPVVGDVIGVFVPGLMFAELNSRPDGKAGFGGGFVFHIPGLPVGPTVSANWNHPLFRPVVSRVIAPLSQFFGYAIRAAEMGIVEPAKQGIQWVKERLPAGSSSKEPEPATALPSPQPASPQLPKPDSK